MKLDEFLACPREKSITDWEKELKRRKRIDNKIRRLSDEIMDCDDALGVLDAEADRDLWVKRTEQRERAVRELAKLTGKENA